MMEQFRRSLIFEVGLPVSRRLTARIRQSLNIKTCANRGYLTVLSQVVQITQISNGQEQYCRECPPPITPEPLCAAITAHIDLCNLHNLRNLSSRRYRLSQKTLQIFRELIRLLPVRRMARLFVDF